MENTIKVENLNKSFNVASGSVQVLKNLNFEIKGGEFTIIYGPSGCGKSTLLHTILGLEEPTSGKVFVFGKDMYQDYTENSVARFRKNNIGMVYQQSNWVKALNVEENAALPLALLGQDGLTRITKAREMLNSLHMLEWAKYQPSELSSGQQQKVSLSRALITNPKIIIADEPTGNLDFESGEELIKILQGFSKQENKTVVMVTHDLEYLKYADTCIKMLNGEIQKIFSPKTDKEELNEINMKRRIYEKITGE
ncbi:MAG: ABC transporter ATP-binding protein [Candidatus Dojkabacteria bacterium]|jgi:putative ABC transport system ATP-binding protein|nr:ABC transporter ATP-binding protein [Candidatus Dojkabacteria bacterium]